MSKRSRNKKEIPTKADGKIELCGATTRRKGTKCQNLAMDNGRCRLHGGKSTGAPIGNKNNLITGEHETIWFDTLEDDEKLLYDKIDTDVLKQIIEEIKLITIRERRMMERIKELKNEEFIEVEKEIVNGIDKGKLSRYKKKKYETALNRINNIEEALTRVQDKKAKLIDMKFRFTPNEGNGNPNISAWLNALSGAAKGVWDEEE